MKFGFTRHNGFSGKEDWKCWIWVALDKGQWMTLTFDIHIGPCTHLVNCINQLWHHRWNIHCFIFFPYKSIRDQNWSCRKIGQGQPRVIIWTNLVLLEHPMLQIMFQGHRLFGFDEDVLRFSHIWQPSWPCDLDRLNTHLFPRPKEAPYEIWLQLAQWFQRKICLKMLTYIQHIHTYGRQRPTYPICSPLSIRLRSAKYHLCTQRRLRSASASA